MSWGFVLFLFVCFLCINVPLKSFSRSTELNPPLALQVSPGDCAKEEGQLWAHWARSQIDSILWQFDLGQVICHPQPCVLTVCGTVTWPHASDFMVDGYLFIAFPLREVTSLRDRAVYVHSPCVYHVIAKA